MAKFQFSRARNPVNTSFISEPKNEFDEQLEPIKFTLKPIETNTHFMVRRWRYSSFLADMDLIQHEIGLSRISDWDDVYDENGAKVEFNEKNFNAFLRMPETIEYVMDIGAATIKEVMRIEDLEQKKQEKEPTPAPEDSSEKPSKTIKKS